MILFGHSAAMIEKLRNDLPDGHRVIQWAFSESNTGLSDSPVPLNTLHLRAWRERYAASLRDLVIAQMPNQYGPLVDLTCDRIFVDRISSNDRILYLARLEALLRGEVQEIPPGVAVFETTPHFPWELLVTKVLLAEGHRVFSFRPTPVDGRILVQEHLISGRLRFVSRDEFGEASPEHEMDLDGSFSIKQVAPVSQDTLSAHYFKTSDSLRLVANRVTRVLLRRVKLMFRNVRSFEAEVIGGLYFEIYAARKNRFLQAKRIVSAFQNRVVLRSLSTRHVPSEYVLFMLHFQPERATDPEAGVARFQTSALVDLRKKMDSEGMESMAIVVREHPRQVTRFDLETRRLLARPAEFYKTIAGLHDCFLVVPEVNSESLIAEAKLVVTSNGTSAWEALLEGCPAITFAETWHSTCGASPNWDAVISGDVSLRQLLEMDQEAVDGSVKEFLKTERNTHVGDPPERHDKAASPENLQNDTIRLLAELATFRV